MGFIEKTGEKLAEKQKRRDKYRKNGFFLKGKDPGPDIDRSITQFGYRINIEKMGAQIVGKKVLFCTNGGSYLCKNKLDVEEKGTFRINIEEIGEKTISEGTEDCFYPSKCIFSVSCGSFCRLGRLQAG